MWSKTKDAEKKIPLYKPLPYVPPFIKLNTEESKEYEVHTVDDIKDILTRPRT